MADDNYVEYSLFVNQVSPKFGWKTDVGEQQFKSILQHYARHNTKFSQKQYKEFVYGDIFYHNYIDNELKVFRLTPLSTSYDKKRLCMHFNKQKLSLINVPSTASMDTVRYVKHLVYRISHRVFLNFVVKKEASTNICTYDIYVNYNHTNNVEMDIVTKQLEQLFKQVEAPIS